MGLMEQIKADIHSITTNTSDFGVSLLFENPLSSPVESITVVVTAKKHRTQFDEYGMPKTQANTKTVTCSVSIVSFSGYTITNGSGVYDFTGHTVTWTDATTVAQKYCIGEWHPDETVGLIVFILEEYGS